MTPHLLYSILRRKRGNNKYAFVGWMTRKVRDEKINLCLSMVSNLC